MCSSIPNPFTLTQTHHNPTRITLFTRPKPGSIRAQSSPNSVTYSRPDPNPTLYQVLGISNNVSLGEIKKAYKEMALRFHPDLSPPGRAEEYTERFIRVQEAYETLSDPKQRDLYDGDLSSGLRLGFSARQRRFNNRDDLEMEDRSAWKTRWQSQISELKLRSANKNSRGSMSWGATIRRQNNESSDEV